MNFLEFQSKFPTERSIIDYFIQIRYNGNIGCVHCGSMDVYHRKDKPKLFTCKDCNNSFSVFKDTIFEKSNTDLRKWFYAIHLFLNAKKGISGLQLQREVNVTYKTAWRMLKQIRTAMTGRDFRHSFDAVVEIDETYVGGKPRKRNKGRNDVGNKRGRGTQKTPVIGIVDRNNKRVYAKVALPDSEGKKLTSKQILGVLNEVTKKGATVITDEFRSYDILSNKDSRYCHLRVDHTVEFANGNIHTNGIESFWGTLKRGVYGIYHSVSPKYLQNYVDEFCFRYNNRENGDVFDLVLLNSVKDEVKEVA